MTNATWWSIEDEHLQDMHERLVDIFNKLPTSLIRQGMRTFEHRSPDERYARYNCCFVAMVYSPVVGELRDQMRRYGLLTVWEDRFKPYLTFDELEYLSVAHFDHPEVVYVTAMDFLS